VRRELFGCCCYCYCCREQQGSWFGVVGLSAHPPYIHSCQPPAPGRRPPSLIDAGTGFIPPTGTNGVYLKAVSDARSPSWVPGGTWKPRHLEQSSFQKPWTLLATRRLHSRQLILLLALHQPTQSSRGRAWGQLAAQTSLQPSGCRGLRSRRRRAAALPLEQEWHAVAPGLNHLMPCKHASKRGRSAAAVCRRWQRQPGRGCSLPPYILPPAVTLTISSCGSSRTLSTSCTRGVRAVEAIWSVASREAGLHTVSPDRVGR
jgi:hypothetical protein